MSALLRPPHWTELALCAEVDPELHFPERGGTTAPAKKVCAACLVTVTCLEWAMANPDASRFGVWGGTSERERRHLRTQPALAVAA